MVKTSWLPLLMCLFLSGAAGACSSEPTADEQLCQPGTEFCLANELHRCNDDGVTDTLVQVCAGFCSGSKCQELPEQDVRAEPGDLGDDTLTVCLTGAVVCQDGTLFTCNQEGTAWDEQECPAGCADEKACSLQPADTGSPEDIVEEVAPWPTEVIEEVGCNECAPQDFYCTGIKGIYHCMLGEDGCWVWDEGTVCEDGNPCTDDACAANKGCVAVDNIAPCDDGDPCTVGDKCSSGLCIPGTSICQCVVEADCAPLEDGDLCNGMLTCLNGNCVLKEGSLVQCPPSLDLCQGYWCNPGTGQCEAQPAADDTPCDDNDGCTLDDVCLDGLCAGVPADCSDLDGLCVVGLCQNGACIEEFTDEACDDGNPETCNDKCQQGACLGSICGELHGEDCWDAIDLGEGGSFEADLCDYQNDYDFDFCDFHGPDLFFKVKAVYFQGFMEMDTSGSFPNMVVALRLWNENHCESTGSFGCGAGVSWAGGLGLTNHLYFGVSSSDGSCGTVKVTAFPQEN